MPSGLVKTPVWLQLNESIPGILRFGRTSWKRRHDVLAKTAQQPCGCLFHVNLDRLAHFGAERLVRAVAELQRQCVIARRQLDVRFRLRLAEMK